MKVRRQIVLFFWALILLATLLSNARGSCMQHPPGPPCQAFWQNDAVFIGTATRVEHIPNDAVRAPGSLFRKTAYLTVEAKGVNDSVVVLELDYCGYLFKQGERYLVYAHRNPHNNKLDVQAGTTRTRPLAEAGEDLKYIRGLSVPERGARIFGKVMKRTVNIKERRLDAEPLKIIKVILEGVSGRREAVTDSEGRYQFLNLPAGTYWISAELPSDLFSGVHAIKVTGRECVTADFFATRKGEIFGRVLDRNEKPLEYVPSSLVSAGARLEHMLFHICPEFVRTLVIAG